MDRRGTTTVTFTCEQCAAPYQRSPCFAEKTRYCSKRCLGLAQVARAPIDGHRNPNWRGGKLKPCLVCGKEVWVRPSADHTKKYCSRVCQVIGRPKDANNGRWTRSPEFRNKMSELRRGISLSEEAKAKIGAAHRGIPHSQETLARIRAAAARRMQRVILTCAVCSKPFSVIASTANLRISCSKECYRELQRGRMRQRMAVKEFRERALQGLLHRTSPNKPERNLQRILDSLYPSEWEYVGDGKVVLNGLIPDFININGKKQVIEMFGDYWHGPRARNWRETELGRVMAFNSMGFACLIVWEHELDDEDSVREKVIGFMKTKKKRTLL